MVTAQCGSLKNGKRRRGMTCRRAAGGDLAIGPRQPAVGVNSVRDACHSSWVIHHGQVSHRLLLADDDRAIRESLERALELEGYSVTSVADGVQALSAIRRKTPDVVILDVMMPGVDGLGVCRVIRADGMRLPILMLTARVEVDARVAGLDAGADDYLAKPFELDELLARLRALLRRATKGSSDPGGQVLVDGLRIDGDSRRVWWREIPLDLS